MLATIVILAVVLMTGPLVLGAAREWIDLPLLGGVALLGFIQGLRLAVNRPEAGGRRVDAIDWSVILFTVYTVARWLTSPAEYISRLEMFDVVGCAAIFLTCRHGVAHRRVALSLLYLLVVLGVGETVFGYEFSKNLDWRPFGPTELLHLHYAPRWLGTYGCPNHYGFLLVMSTAAALAIGCYSRLAWPLRIVFLYLAFMMMLGVIHSGSRGSWIALAVAVGMLVVWSLRHGSVRWYVPVGASTLLVVLIVVLASLSTVARQRSVDLMTTVNGGGLNTYVRVELARDAIHIAHDHPLFGTGPATFEFVHPRYQDATFMFKAVLAHDDYLNCLDDYGLVGFALMMFFVWAVTLKFFRPLDLDNRWQDRVVAATGFAVWFAILVHSFLDFNMHIPANARLLFALTGLALSRYKQEPELAQNWSTVSLAPLGRWLGVAILVLSVAYGVYVVKSAASDIVYEGASNDADVKPTIESIASMKQALAYDPQNGQAWLLLGDLHRYRASRQKEMSDRLDEGRLALDAYQRALAANPYDDTILARMGRIYDVMHRYPEAFFCYSQAVTLQPYNGEFWYRLGNHYWVRGLLGKAEEAYLLSEACPHGFNGSREAEDELRKLPEMQGVPLPAPGTNPLTAPDANEPREIVP
jgi:O-antigen ligase